MTSLYEPPGSMPVDLMAYGRRGVSLLEFCSLEGEDEARVEQSAARAVVETHAEYEAHARARQVAAMVDAAREEAAAEARREVEEEIEERLGEERRRVERACGEFARDRQKYFAAVETQVVRLALAIARKVLAREVEADGMHLEATVRAALARVHDQSATVLRVRGEDAAAWRAIFAGEMESRVEVVGDARMRAGECVLETEVGRVEMGVEVQMTEIERGFAELTRRQGD